MKEGFPPPHDSHELQIFDSLPVADATTFKAGVPSTSTEDEQLSVILFSPNLQSVVAFDNTKSKATSNYSFAVSHGFTFSSTQGFSIAASVGVSVVVVTASVTTTFSMSFTEQWSKTTTTTMSFSCPPAEKAFVYQGTLMSKLLKFDARTAQYSYMGAAANALTPVLVTTDVPMVAPASSVTINS